MTTETLQSKAAKAVGWTVLRFGGDQVFGFVVFAALSRMLVPAQFGVFIVALAVAEIGKIVAQAGLVSSLYRAPSITPKLADTVFWANLGMGCLVALFFFVFRFPLARGLGSVEAAPVIGVIGCVVPISAAGASHMSRNLREFGHRALAIRSLFAGLVGGTLALAAALAGWGVWALVVQRFAAEIVGTIIAWRAFRWKPGLDFSWSTLRAQLGLGSSVAGSQLLLVVLNRTQDVIISRMIGISAVGVYRTAWKSIEIVAQGVITPFSTVAVPTLAKLQHEMAAYRRAYLRIVGTSAIIAFPAIIGIGSLADLLIPLLFGPQWTQAIPVTRVLCFLAAPFALNFFGDPALTVLGKSSVIAKLALVQIILTLLFCIAAAPYGLFWFAVAFVAREYLTMVLQLLLLQRETGIRALDVIGVVLAPLTAAAGMGALLVGLAWVFPAPVEVTEAIRLARTIVLVGVGMLIYPALLLPLLGRPRRKEIFAFLSSVMARKPTRA